MPATIPNLWPKNDVSVNVLSPVAILRAQASSLTQMTKGLLQGEVTSIALESGRTQYHLDIVAPALENYRHRLLSVTQPSKMNYPVSFLGQEPILGYKGDDTLAYSEQQFINKLQDVLNSEAAVAVLQSLISRSNEAQESSTQDVFETAAINGD